jgi:hypothetical protein
MERVVLPAAVAPACGAVVGYLDGIPRGRHRMERVVLPAAVALPAGQSPDS